jgi:hypothetical protein
VAIHELDAPLVASLQAQIRQQHALIESIGEACDRAGTNEGRASRENRRQV